LTDGGSYVQPHLQGLLLSEIFGPELTIILAVVNGLLINTAAQFMVGGFVFLAFSGFDVLLAIWRIWLVRKAAAASRLGKPTPTDMYLVAVICWWALQGAMAYTAMCTGKPVLQLLFGFTVLASMVPLCTVYYATPRYTMLLLCLCDLPATAGEMTIGNRWIVVALVQAPAFILACNTAIRRLHRMAVTLLEAEYLSEQRAERDSLTGLMNRAGLADILLGLEVRGTRFVLFYLDLDGFKAVNDTLGHPAGDALLQAVASRLQAMMRDSDTVARLGGDEFVVVTPNLGPAESTAFANRVIQRISDQEYALGAEGVARIGVSVGYACWPEDGPTLDLLRKHADSALYTAKKAGKGVHRRFAGPGIDLKEDLRVSPARLP
jgi:diguanylate cyclase (GGDEF)-like protein